MTTSEPSAEAVEAKDLLERLCDYYLDCLATERPGDVSVFAQSKYEPDYVELKSLPGVGDDDPLSTDGVLAFLTRNRDAKKVHYVGYPVNAKFVRAKSSDWQGYFLEPLFLFPVDRTARTAEVWPSINPKALESLSGLKGRALLDEGIDLLEELVGDGESPPELTSLIHDLQVLRPDWPWAEQMDPETLASIPPIASPGMAGLHNRAILVASERPPFTVGLEYELRQLKSLGAAQLEGTALGYWLGLDGLMAEKEVELLTPFPLNDEQLQAVEMAMSDPLTVVTGPPGTGKSQVVSSIVVNSAWHHRSMLFASKNNHAVDVVADRTNALGSRPVMLRLGNVEHQAGVVEHLTQILSSKASAADATRYADLLNEYREISVGVAKTRLGIERVVAARNEVDGLEQKSEEARAYFSRSPIRLETIDHNGLASTLNTLRTAVDRADRSQRSAIVRMLWPLWRERRMKAVRRTRDDIQSVAAEIDWDPAPGPDSDDDLAAWQVAVDDLEERVDALAVLRTYTDSLRQLQLATPISEQTVTLVELEDRATELAEELWELWLRLEPQRLSPEQRKAVDDLSKVMGLLADRPRGKAFGRLMGQFNALFPRTTSVLSCWGVTSLSLRYRVPFIGGFLDSVVIDEASACDIASALPLLFRARRATIIGDPMQLPHVTSLTGQQDSQLLSKHDLLGDAAWSYSKQSLFGRASSIAKSDDLVTLLDHFRSHADIIEFSNEQFYEGRLRVATRYEGLTASDGPSVRWIECRGKTERPSNGSAINRAEADAVVTELSRLVVGFGYKGSVGVVSPFRAQVNLIKDRIRANRQLSSAIERNGILVDTAHGFQGDERDVIIFSTVISAGAHDGALSFLRRTPKLFNVAITRARSALVVIGDRRFIASSGVSHLAAFGQYIDDLVERRPTGETKRDYGSVFPEGLLGDSVSEWEAMLYEALYRRGIKTQPQMAVEKYRLDLALLDGQRKLDIEIDGEHYHRTWDGEITHRDRIRNTRLVELGWDVLRFWVYEIRDDLDGCVDRVQEWMAPGSSTRAVDDGEDLEPASAILADLVPTSDEVEERSDQEEVCKHGLVLDQCHMCKNNTRVYVTGGGWHYHLDRDCAALKSGQNQVQARGGTTEPIVSKSLSWAFNDGRDPCKKCARGGK